MATNSSVDVLMDIRSYDLMSIVSTQSDDIINLIFGACPVDDLKFLSVANNRLRAIIVPRIRSIIANLELEASPQKCMLEISAKQGYLDRLKYLIEGCNYFRHEMRNYSYRSGAACNALLNGHLVCFKYLYDNGHTGLVDTLRFATMGGYDYCLKHVISLQGKFTDHEWASAAEVAASKGHVDCLKRIMRHSPKSAIVNLNLCTNAAEGGSLACLKYVHEYGYLFEIQTGYKAAINGHMECVKYLNENEFTWNSLVYVMAASTGKLEIIKYLHENHCSVWNKSACSAAAAGGHLDVLKYLHENGCEWDSVTCSWAARHGYLHILMYAHDNGCDWDEAVCNVAAEYGYMDCLKYAHEKGCEWGVATCKAAAISGNLDCLMYLHNNGCPWDEKTIKAAIYYSTTKCLEYAIVNGCPLLSQGWKPRRSRSHIDIGETWIRQGIFKSDPPRVVNKLDKLQKF